MNILKECELKYKLYYPLPDYEITNVIYTDECKPKNETIYARDINISRYNEYLSFSERNAYKEILKENEEMFSFFASVAEMAMRRKAGLDDNLPKNILADVDKILSEWTYLGLVGVIEASLLSLKMLEAYVQSSNCIDSFFLKILEVRRKCKQ